MLDFDKTERKVWLYGVVQSASRYSDEDSFSDSDVHSCLRKMGSGPLTVHVNSSGGVCDMGLAIFNALKHHSGIVTTVVDSVAASIASVIFCAGRKRLMYKQGHVMAHLPHTVGSGNAAELRKTAEVLDVYAATMLAIYAETMPSLSKSQLIELLEAEVWWPADEAVSIGLATGIFGEADEQIEKRLAACKVGGPSADQLSHSRKRLAGLAAAENHSAQFAATVAKHERRKRERQLEIRTNRMKYEKRQREIHHSISAFHKEQ